MLIGAGGRGRGCPRQRHVLPGPGLSLPAWPPPVLTAHCVCARASDVVPLVFIFI